MKTQDRVQELLQLPMNQAPWQAIALMKFLSAKYGYCGEIACSAYAAYARVIENTEGGEDDFDLESKRFLQSLPASVIS